MVLDWPESLARVSGCGFWPERLVAHSGGMFNPNGYAEDKGVIWRASVEFTSSPQKGSCEFGEAQAFLADLQGGVRLARLWDFRYCRPMGRARTRDDLGRMFGPVTWDGGCHWEGGAKWRAQGGVVLSVPAGAGATTLHLFGGFPGEKAVCAWDRVTINGRVYIVAAAEVVGADTKFTVRLFDGLADAAEAGTPVALGGRFSKVMRWLNPDAANNFTKAGEVIVQRLEFREWLTPV